MTSRAPGRPRSAECDRAIVDAVLDLLVEGGVARLSVEAVAARAGVGKATIYRRWPSKDQLIVDAVATLVPELDEVELVGEVRADLVALVSRLPHAATTSRAAQVMPVLLGGRSAHPELTARYLEHVVLPRRRMLAGVVRDAVARGELRPDVDVELVVDQVIGPLVYRLLVFGPESMTPRTPEHVVDALLDGLRPRD